MLLIDMWRKILIGWNAFLPFGVATRIWFASNLGKYLPGKIWSVAAMSVMAREYNVSPITATGSSVIIQLITIATGIGIALVTGTKAIDQPGWAIALGVILIGSLALLPGTTYIAPGRAATALREHGELVDAIEKRDIERAENVARTHVRAAERLRLLMTSGALEAAAVPEKRASRRAPDERATSRRTSDRRTK